jgi:hypothetical protein
MVGGGGKTEEDQTRYSGEGKQKKKEKGNMSVS